jgi:hypothetical protein
MGNLTTPTVVLKFWWFLAKWLFKWMWLRGNGIDMKAHGGRYTTFPTGWI